MQNYGMQGNVMFTNTRLISGSMLALALSCVSAEAQTQAPPSSNCQATRFTDGVGSTYNTCIAADMARLDTIYVPFVVQRMLARSFGFGPSTVEPTGLSGLTADQANARLESSGFVIAPTADTAAAAALSPRWNGWVDGRYLDTDYSNAAGDLDGPTLTGMAGLDYKLNSKVSLGILVSAEKSDLASAVSDLSSSTYGIGPYLGIVLTDNIVFSANLLASHMNSSQMGGLLDFDTDRLQSSAALNGYWYKGTWRFTPGLTLAWSKDWESENNGFLNDRTIETGVLTPSFQLGNTLRLSDTTTVEPWAGAALDWTFLSDVHTAGFGTVSDASTDLRLQAGLNFGFGSNAQLAITGEASGLLNKDLDSYSVEANLAIQF